MDPALLAAVLDGVQRFYADARDFKADFKQTFTYKIYQRKKVSTGEVFFKKPALMRWDYEAPSRRLFIADGGTLWVYEPEEAQVFKRDLASAQLPVALRFMKGEGKLTDDFAVGALHEESDAYRLHLTPKRPSSEYQALQLVVNKAQHSVRASVLVDPVGNTNHIEFVDPVVNSNLPDDGFQFSPPEGVRVIED
ncbi:MAG: outer membrane lipoprotein carrier protein LolA [Deltaproteobacteria bacterium]|nr:outer membrane lipoprotein carrier protein LolA [Deltaproteobacteria bacterium]